MACGDKRRSDPTAIACGSAIGSAPGASHRYPASQNVIVIEPRIAGPIASCVVRIEVDIGTLNIPVADLEHIASVVGVRQFWAGRERRVESGA